MTITAQSPMPRSTVSLARRALTILARLPTLDALLLLGAIGVCALLFSDGGLEALAGAAAGAGLAHRNRLPRISGAFAGLFAGALFAGFFHAPLEALIAGLQ